MKTAVIETKNEAFVLPDNAKWQTDKIDQLLIVLDEDIRHIQQSLSRLNELRSLVVKRDEKSLADLLGKIQDETDNYIANELKRQSLRKDLAIALNCNLEQITLSSLEDVLPEEESRQVAQRKTKLRVLTSQLKREYSSTVLLLSECARFNNLLLRHIFCLGKNGTITYSSNGQTKQQNDTAFVNLQF